MKSLSVPGVLDSLDLIAEYVMEAAAEAGLDKKATYKLRLAVDEIATNIVTHGYEEGGCQGDMDIHSEISDQYLTIYIEDTAREFNPAAKITEELERVNQPINERIIGGLGIFLVLDGVDDFIYERVGNKNRNTFKSKIPESK
jgi:hypothetical protein